MDEGDLRRRGDDRLVRGDRFPGLALVQERSRCVELLRQLSDVDGGCPDSGACGGESRAGRGRRRCLDEELELRRGLRARDVLHVEVERGRSHALLGERDAVGSLVDAEVDESPRLVRLRLVLLDDVSLVFEQDLDVGKRVTLSVDYPPNGSHQSLGPGGGPREEQPARKDRSDGDREASFHRPTSGIDAVRIDAVRGVSYPASQRTGPVLTRQGPTRRGQPRATPME
jgi:hypothetical protein